MTSDDGSSDRTPPLLESAWRRARRRRWFLFVAGILGAAAVYPAVLFLLASHERSHAPPSQARPSRRAIARQAAIQARVHAAQDRLRQRHSPRTLALGRGCAGPVTIDTGLLAGRGERTVTMRGAIVILASRSSGATQVTVIADVSDCGRRRSQPSGPIHVRTGTFTLQRLRATDSSVSYRVTG